MAKVTVVKKSSDQKEATTAEHKRVRAERIARQMAKSALTWPRRGRAGRRAK